MADKPESPDFQTLVDTYYEALYRFGYSLAKNGSDAADLVQETFRIWAEKGDALRDNSKVKSWLFTTLYREFLRSRRRDRFHADVEDDVLARDFAAPDTSVTRRVAGREAMEALQEVDEVYREPLALFYIEDASYKEIAERLEIPIGTVMSRLSRGKAQLRALLRQKVE